tara:strand:- start:7287 stop:7730 length:444 start_codon:yes stop_codon:yes gene_type:complete
MFQFFLAGASVISAYSQMQAGRAAQAAANAEALQFEQERRQNEIITAQRHVDRLAQYDAARANNAAWFAFSGRDISDRSVKAFMDKQREVAYTDVSRSDTQGYAESAQLAMQAQLARTRGVMARRTANIQALSTLASGLYQYETVRV